jgi:hypothetical protein
MYPSMQHRAIAHSVDDGVRYGRTGLKTKRFVSVERPERTFAIRKRSNFTSARIVDVWRTGARLSRGRTDDITWQLIYDWRSLLPLPQYPSTISMGSTSSRHFPGTVGVSQTYGFELAVNRPLLGFVHGA